MNQPLVSIFCINRLDDKQVAPTPTTSPTPIVEYQGKWAKSILKFAVVKASKDLPDTHETVIAVKLCLQNYSDNIPIQFILVSQTENPDLTYEWVDGANDGVIKGDNGIVAYSGFPDSSGSVIHIRFNDSLNWSFRGTNFQFNPLNTITHETGHAMGLVHSPDCPKCIMYNFYNGVIDLAPLDISRLQGKYGIKTWANGVYQRIEKAIYNWKRRLP